jgi:hypothetical protein
LIDPISYRFGAPDAALRSAPDACNLEQLSTASHIVMDANSVAEVLDKIREIVA